MGNFLRESFAELEHVVWPTKRETQTYYKIVVSFIVICTVILFILGYIFGEAVFGLKNLIGGGDATNVQLESLVTDDENFAGSIPGESANEIGDEGVSNAPIVISEGDES